MAIDDAPRPSRKRKQVEDELEIQSPDTPVQLEMLTDDEETVDISSVDGDADEFPEIDANSDSDQEKGEEEGTDLDDEEDDSAEDQGDNNGDADSEDDSDELDSDAPLYVFPEAKTIISNITGQPKRIYPEIEPDYDSDSSTEDVRLLFQATVT
jgi:ribosome biogenesis protein ERB1